MSITDNYLKILAKICKKKTKGYFLTKQGATRSDIDSILKSKDVLTSKAKRIADALNISLDTLVTGNIKKLPMENQLSEEPNNYENHKPTKKGDERIEGKLYDIESLNQEKIDFLQEIIDNWKVEDTNKRKEERIKRASKTKSQKNKTA